MFDPLLCLIYINDLPDVFFADVRIFADILHNVQST